MFIHCLFNQAGASWKGETHALKTMQIEAMETGGGLQGRVCHIQSHLNLRACAR